MPESFSKSFISLLKGLLNKDPTNRLTIEDIKAHNFFKPISWAKLEKGELKPPIIPKLKLSKN